jgi:Calx-beta domain
MKPFVVIFSASVIAVMTAACGDSKSSNPVAPSAVVLDGPQSAESGGVSGTQAKGGVPGPPDGKGNGNGNGNDNGNGNGKQPPSNTSPTAPVVKKVEIEGLISAKGGDSITVNAQQIVIPSTCPIRHGQTPFTFAELHVGDRVHVRANRTTTTTAGVATTTLAATEVILQNPEDGEGSGDDAPTALVSVAATDAFAAETAGDTGTFTLTRSGSTTLLASPLTVTFTMTGVAANGIDYTNVPLTATFAAGSATTTVVVTPTADAVVEGAESVILTLTAVAPYDLGSPATATVTITDTNVPLITVEAFDSTAAESTSDPGRFRFTRTGATTASLTVTFAVTGTAVSSVDYQTLPVTVTFAAGATTADVIVMPLTDADSAEALETVIVTLTDGASYDLGASPAATVTISN